MKIHQGRPLPPWPPPGTNTGPRCLSPFRVCRTTSIASAEWAAGLTASLLQGPSPPPRPGVPVPPSHAVLTALALRPQGGCSPPSALLLWLSLHFCSCSCSKEYVMMPSVLMSTVSLKSLQHSRASSPGCVTPRPVTGDVCAVRFLGTDAQGKNSSFLWTSRDSHSTHCQVDTCAARRAQRGSAGGL